MLGRTYHNYFLMKNSIILIIFTLIILGSCQKQNGDLPDNLISGPSVEFTEKSINSSIDIGEFHTNISLLSKTVIDSLSNLFYNDLMTKEEFLWAFYGEFLLPTMADSLNISLQEIRNFMTDNYGIDIAYPSSLTQVDWDKNDLLDKDILIFKDEILRYTEIGYSPLIFSDSISELIVSMDLLVNYDLLFAAGEVANSSYHYWYNEYANWNIDTTIISNADPVRADIKGAISGFIVGVVTTGGLGSAGGAAAGATAATLVEAAIMVADKICCDKDLPCCQSPK